ncbi:MAG TPA: hypothetical protein VH500_22865, partial [Nitrososphaeraceae archaeon]
QTFGIRVQGGQGIRLTNNKISNIGNSLGGNAYGIYLVNNGVFGCDGVDVTENDIFDYSSKINVGILSHIDPVAPNLYNHDIHYADNHILLTRDNNVPIFIPPNHVGSRQLGRCIIDDSIVIGEGGTPVTKALASQMSCGVIHLDPGEATSFSVSIDAAPGDLAAASHDKIGQNDVILSANVAEEHTVRVLLLNVSGVPLDIPEGILRVSAWKYGV